MCFVYFDVKPISEYSQETICARASFFKKLYEK